MPTRARLAPRVRVQYIDYRSGDCNERIGYSEPTVSENELRQPFHGIDVPIMRLENRNNYIKSYLHVLILPSMMRCLQYFWMKRTWKLSHERW